MKRIKAFEHKYQIIEFWIFASSGIGLAGHLKCGIFKWCRPLADEPVEHAIYWIIFYFTVMALFVLKIKEHYSHPH